MKHPNNISTATYLHRLEVVKYSRTGKPYTFVGWLGRVNVNGVPRSVVRSARKYGEPVAYLDCLLQVLEWLMEVYPVELVKKKEWELLVAAPEGVEL